MQLFGYRYLAFLDVSHAVGLSHVGVMSHPRRGFDAGALFGLVDLRRASPPSSFRRFCSLVLVSWSHDAEALCMLSHVDTPLAEF